MMRLLRTLYCLVSRARCVACVVRNLPVFRRNFVSTPAVDAVGEGHDILVFLQAHQLAVAWTPEVVVAVVLERCSCLEASNAHHLTRGLGNRGRGDVVLDAGGCGWSVVGSDARQ
jgi:hypothetical protein